MAKTSLVPKNVPVESDPPHPNGVALASTYRDPGCQACELHAYARTICMPGEGPVPANAMVVTDLPSNRDDERGRPLSQMTDAGAYFDSVLRDVGLDRGEVYITPVIKCRAPYNEDRQSFIKVAQRTCGILYLDREITAVHPAAILSMGAPAYFHFTHMSGVSLHRGQAFFDVDRRAWIVPTLSPNAILSNPALHDAFIADVAKFRRLALSINEAPRVNIIEIRSFEDFEMMLGELERQGDRVLTFDIESRGFMDYRPDDTSFVWCVAVSRGNRTGDAIDSYVIPIEHPDSPFLDQPDILRKVVERTCSLVLEARTNNHNLKFDIRWMMLLRDRYIRMGDAELRDKCEKLKSRWYWPPTVRTPRARRVAAVVELEEEEQYPLDELERPIA